MRHNRHSLFALLLVVGACAESVAPPKPTAVVFNAAPPASFEVGKAMPAMAVIVKDEAGRPMAGQPLAIAVVGGGSVAGAPTVTTGGPTPIGTWTLGQKVGANVITITSGTLPPLTFTVQGTAGPLARLTIGSIPAVGTVAATVAVDVNGADAFDNAVANAAIQLTATNDGAISTPTVVSDAGGRATAQWTMGNRRGANVLTATSGTFTTSATVVAQADVPAQMDLDPSEDLTAPAGEPVPVGTRGVVLDRFGNGVPGQSVAFSAAGGGTLASSAARTDTNGVFVSPAWSLGRRKIPQTLTMSLGGLSRTVSAVVASEFKVEIRPIGTMSKEHEAVFEGAASRIRALVRRGAPPVVASAFPIAISCGLTGMAPISETIDGIVIYAGIGAIDGPSKILAQAGPCGFRSAAFNFLPALAVMLFDEADLARLGGGGSLEDVATHEMMHAIGIGTLWGTALVQGEALVDPRYVGTFGREGCVLVASPTLCSVSIPVENTGGEGTAGSHWRETTFRNELMTGFINTGANPLSVMSITALQDLGYLVSRAASDQYNVAAALRATAPAFGGNGVAWERVLAPAHPSDLTPAGGLLMKKRASSP